MPRAALSVVLAAIAVALVARGQRLPATAAAAPGAAAGPIAWNAILRATPRQHLLAGAPITLVPASWQDTGSGVFVLAATTQDRRAARRLA